ncbi:MAG: DUF115 domain-containing protein [Deltaproteobacteria bacterium]|nr:DUF115 domain-containing protein [Deltaproteobacteria bacterium]
MASPRDFERNLARLRRAHPALAAAVAAADSAAIAAVQGPTGATTLVEGGRQIASAYDPAGEGAAQAEVLAASPVDLLVAVGFGLGYHLETFLARRPAARVLVHEPSPARLRAALALRGELPWLSDPALAFAADPDELARAFAQRYVAGLAVRVFLHPSLQALAPDAARAALGRVADTKRSADLVAGTRIAMMETWAALAIENAPALAATPSAAVLFDAFAGVPAVVAAAGPSLDRQLETLAQARKQVLLIAIGQALPALRRAGIEPDLVHVVESKDVSGQLVDGGPAESLALVVPPSVHPRVFATPVRARFVGYPEPNGLACWLARGFGERRWLPGGATVAQSAVHLAAHLGADPILLVGQDLAFTDGRVYARGSAYDMVSLRTLGGGRYAFAGLAEKKSMLGLAPPSEGASDELLQVAGWNGGHVATSRTYAAFLEHYRAIGAFWAARGVRIVNCTEGGARIPGLAHRALAEVLGELPAQTVDVGAIDRAHAIASRPPVAAFAERVAAGRRALGAIERAARMGARAAAEAPRALRQASGLRRRAELLRTIGRAERDVRRALDALPWLDDLTELDRHRNELATRRADATPAAEGAAAEAARLFAATLTAAQRARALLDRLEQQLASVPEAGPTPREDGGPAPGRPAPAHEAGARARAITGAAR